MKIDYTLYYCTDRAIISPASITENVEKALRGGVTVVQLREKQICSRDFYDTAVDLLKVTRRYGVPLIINDRADIALAAGADGVHLGQNDLSCASVKKFAPSLIVGVTAHSLGEALRAQEDGADYIGVGAVFGTSTKGDAKPISYEEVAKIRESIHIPMVIIGGINRQNVVKYKGMGIDGIAVVSAIAAAPDAEKAAMELKRIWTE